MRFVLDANEYIFSIGLAKKESCESFWKFLLQNLSHHSICICRTIAEEVRANLTLQEFQTFIRILLNISNIDEDFFIPFEIGAKYEAKGLKPADAFIAGYTEWTGADILVTENRHFLIHQSNLPFKVLTAERVLKFIK